MIFGTFSSHSWIQRAHSLFSFFMTCTGISFALIALSSFLIKTPNPQVSLYVNHLKLTRGIEDPYMNRLTNLLDFNLSLEVDFTPVVHWNVKQLFVYLVLEYETTSFEKNSIVIWDRIIRRSDAKRISISRLRNKGKNGTLKLYWNKMPWVGFLRTSGSEEVTVRIPDYASK